jgi:hypothetical protein
MHFDPDLVGGGKAGKSIQSKVARGILAVRSIQGPRTTAKMVMAVMRSWTSIQTSPRSFLPLLYTDRTLAVEIFY